MCTPTGAPVSSVGACSAERGWAASGCGALLAVGFKNGCSESRDSCASLSPSWSSGLFTDHADPQRSRTRHGMGVLEGNLCQWK